jgi:cytochrome c biogenesis factor
MPAAEASLPRLLHSEQLEGGNALMMGVDQLAQFVGPALADWIVGFGPPVLFVGCAAAMVAVTAVAAVCRRSSSLDAFEAFDAPTTLAAESA